MARQTNEAKPLGARGGRRLPRSFFTCPAERLAPRLIGHRLVRVLDDGTRLSGVIVETEAYLGARDKACHTYGGRRTARNEAMYGVPGSAYVYFTYGMHFCMNVVCGDACEGVAVLIRAIEPVEGHERMRRHRGGHRTWKDTDLCSGPAKLCQALAIDRAWNGVDLVEGAAFFLERGTPVGSGSLHRTTRIGIDGRGVWTSRLLRWYLKGSRHVSVYERSGTKHRPPTKTVRSLGPRSLRGDRSGTAATKG